MAIDKLAIYNDALLLIGERQLTIISEDREPRRVLDTAYGFEAINYCLEIVKPVFARKTATLNTPTTSPDHGLDSVHALPSDYISLVEIYSDEKLDQPIGRFINENGEIACEFDTIYIRYVSTDNSEIYADWTPTFARVVSSYLARDISTRLTPDLYESLDAKFKDRVQISLGIEQSKEPSKRSSVVGTTLTDELRVIYNNSLLLAGLDRIDTNTDDSKRRSALDTSVESGAIKYCFELVKPSFARKTIKLTVSNPSTEHGFNNVFDLPADYITLIEVYSDENLDQPVSRFINEDRTIACDFSTIYVRYISDDKLSTYTEWSPVFTNVVHAYLAREISVSLNPDTYAFLGDIFKERTGLATAYELEKEPIKRSSVVGLTLTDELRVIYNNALLLAGLERLDANDDDSDRRSALDTSFESGAVDYCLELIKPVFSKKTTKLSVSTPSTEHGLDNVFTLPSDNLSLIEVYSDEKLDQPVSRFINEAKTVACEFSTIYIRYVSNDKSQVYSDWSPTFTNALASYLAREISGILKPESYGALDAKFKERVESSLSIENSKEPSQRSSVANTVLTDELRVIYNNALLLVGLGRLDTNDDDSERRVSLDTAYEAGAVDYCLEIIKPSFSLKTSNLTASVTSHDHDLDNVYTLPGDYVNMEDVYSDARLDQPVGRYIIDGETLSCEYDSIYIRYIANSYAISSWSASFKRAITAFLAKEIALTYVGSDKFNDIEATFSQRIEAAITLESDKEPQKRSKASTTTLSQKWLNIYNDALLIMGLEKITDNNDDSERRSVLDTAIDADLVEAALEDIGWHWALKSVKSQFNPSLEPDWGYSRAHDKPDDMHRLEGVYYDEYFQRPLKTYLDEDEVFYTDEDEIFLQYVSTSFYNNPDGWSPSFRRLIGARLAKDCYMTLNPRAINKVKSEFDERESAAKSIDIMQSPPRLIAEGSWVRSRNQGRSQRRRP